MVLREGVTNAEVAAELEKIPYDKDGLDAQISFRDKYTRPYIVAVLMLEGIASLVFSAMLIYGVAERISWLHATDIAYTVIMGTLTAIYMVLDWTYTLGIVGYPTTDQLPKSVYKLTRRYERSYYLAPGRYYDDRVPDNIVSIQLMRYTIPFIVLLSITAIWVGERYRQDDTDDPSGSVRSVMSIVFVLVLQIYLMKIIASNRFKIYVEWDDIPTSLQPYTEK